jgi:hypothetical protein
VIIGVNNNYAYNIMMTFIVIGDFIINAQLLDDKRLAKQRVEAMQIINILLAELRGDPALSNTKQSWINHPIVKAWRGYIPALQYYTNCVILEFIRRGGKNNMQLYNIMEAVVYPWWTQWDRLHNSHRAMLLRKDPFFYSNRFTVPSEYCNYGYIWPHTVTNENYNHSLEYITAPIPKELINPVFCSALLQSGKRKGQACNLLVKDKHVHCKRHRK